ncbi:MAG: hypothetical protein MZV64_13545 [Ignavibacteriales bacterium]|nr:hypothetical protein [Ignavibacteriales bacterium]
MTSARASSKLSCRPFRTKPAGVAAVVLAQFLVGRRQDRIEARARRICRATIVVAHEARARPLSSSPSSSRARRCIVAPTRIAASPARRPRRARRRRRRCVSPRPASSSTSCRSISHRMAAATGVERHRRRRTGRARARRGHRTA